MTWRCYLTIFKAESPIHIGYKQTGILKTTRYYITGRAMWGAITANLTRALFDNPAPEDYQAVGNFVRESIRTTYFYPAIKKNEASSDLSEYEINDHFVFLPEYTDKGINFGNKSKEWFEQMFVGSFVSTALESQTKTAEEGSLHEFEYIQNKIRLNDGSKNPTQVYWVGYLFVNESKTKAKDNEGKRVYEVDVIEENDDLRIILKNEDVETYALLKKDILNLLFVGGERNYGFGKLTLEPVGFRSENQKLFGKFKIELNVNEPVIEITSMVLAHLNLESIELEETFRGEIEPVVGLEWSEGGAGHRISSAVVCAVPGSYVPVEECVLGEFGILRLMEVSNHKS